VQRRTKIQKAIVSLRVEYVDDFSRVIIPSRARQQKIEGGLVATDGVRLH
jgi:hypothetical protein